MKKMSCMLLIFVLVALSGCSYFLPTEDTAGNSVSNIDIVTTTQEVEQESTLSPYEQAYPVQDYQKAYARFLDTLDSYEQIFCIRVDNDEIPELVVSKSSFDVTLYGYDGTEVYKVSEIGMCQYGLDFYYRPCLGMICHYTGSVMVGGRYLYLYEFKEENGRLIKSDTIKIATPLVAELFEGEVGIPFGPYINEYEDTIKYDIRGMVFGESWKLPDEQSIVDDSKIQYWLNN